MDLLSCNLPGIPKVRSGKVREIFDLGETLLFVATDRISAFDCILPNPIPYKGEVLTEFSRFWFERFKFVQNHVIETEFRNFPAKLQPYEAELRGRSMIVRKAQPLPVECVVRGFVVGGGWKEYCQTGAICGISLPLGLQIADRLPQTIFTPSTKAESGHDINISWEKCCELVGEDVAKQIRDLSIHIYEAGSEYAAKHGIIVADTKFEFGLIDGRVILIDECLTPDSSRFWPSDQYKVGSNPPSYDKQFVRDYLETLDWDKTPPAPSLPQDVIDKTSRKYRDALTALTGIVL